MFYFLKTKGFCTCLEELRASLSAVYDVTIGYKYRCPSFLDNVFGLDPSEVHIHVRRFPLDLFPVSEDEIASWLMDRFQCKDQLLSRGQFPNQVSERDLSDMNIVWNCMMVIMLTSTCFFYIFTSVWFKLYVTLACAYLGTATFFHVRPQPIPGFLKNFFTCHLSKT
ncbi:hypothetical protein L6164_035596 [Bauhinia variegata]|uniref:Uncharacterized protein n=1 Tax=Bauhinia variegata TaxID=167791 RepID=A0ACB9KEI4_BAUVA|nr:hypothetical protein L6164_035596 [Bauhinia variegata]